MIFSMGIFVKFNYQFLYRITKVNDVITNTVLSSDFLPPSFFDFKMSHNSASAGVELKRNE